MKRKGTLKVRKNKRTTQRRKNRSYKRMRGGVYNYKQPSWFNKKQPIPQEVIDDIENITGFNIQAFVNKHIIDTKSKLQKLIKLSKDNPTTFTKMFNDTLQPNLTSDQYLHSLIELYSNLIADHPSSETSEFYTRMNNIIKTEIEKLIIMTGEERLKRIFSYQKTSQQMIHDLKKIGFLPDKKEEIIDLLTSYLINKSTQLRIPFTYNGLALASFIIIQYTEFIQMKKQEEAAAAAAKTAAVTAASTGTTIIPLKHIFVFNPRINTKWEPLSFSILPNPICNNRQRIRMGTYSNDTQAGSHSIPYFPFGAEDRMRAVYDHYVIPDNPDNITPEIVPYITIGNQKITKMKSHDDKDTDDKRSTQGEYKLYEMKKREDIKYTFNRYDKTTIPVTTVYEYDEDGIINWALISIEMISDNDLLQMGFSQTNIPTLKNDMKDLVIRTIKGELMNNLYPTVDTSLQTKGNLESLIDLSKYSFAAAQELNEQRYTVNYPTDPNSDLSVQPAERAINQAFNKVNNFLVSNGISYDRLQIKMFGVVNERQELVEIIIVKKMNMDHTLKHAIYKFWERNVKSIDIFDSLNSASAELIAAQVRYNQHVTPVRSTGLNPE